MGTERTEADSSIGVGPLKLDDERGPTRGLPLSPANCRSRSIIEVGEDQLGREETVSYSLMLFSFSLVQAGKSGHSSVEDAQATMELYKLVEVEWEQHLVQNPPKD